MKFKRTWMSLPVFVTLALVIFLTLFSSESVSKASAAPTFGNATAADILNGKTATADAGQITGVMADRSGGLHVLATGATAGVKSAGDSNNNAYLQPPAGYYDGTSWVKSPQPDLVSSNILSGKNILGVAGGITNMATSNPNGLGAGRSYALGWSTGGSTGIYFKPQAGYYDGINTWTEYTDPNLVPANILSGKSILGVSGTAINGAGKAGHATGSGTTNSSGYAVVSGLGFTPTCIQINCNNIICQWDSFVSSYDFTSNGGRYNTTSVSSGGFNMYAWYSNTGFTYEAFGN